jgi:hypothetical protein
MRFSIAKLQFSSRSWENYFTYKEDGEKIRTSTTSSIKLTETLKNDVNEVFDFSFLPYHAKSQANSFVAYVEMADGWQTTHLSAQIRNYLKKTVGMLH